MTGILIVAGIRLHREGLAQLFVCHPDIMVLGTYANVRDLMTGPPLDRANVILFDMTPPDAPDSMSMLRTLGKSLPVVVIGVSDSDADVIAAAEAGAAAYVTREGSIEDLVSALTSAAKGELICSARIAGTLARRVAELAAASQIPSPYARLTRREREIAMLLGEDLSNKEIAVRLRIEVATVKNHVHNLLDKLNAHSRLEASRALSLSSHR